MADDSITVANVLSRRPGGFEQLVRRHQALVWHIVYRMVQDQEDARELSQEVFLRVSQRLGQFRFESSLATWIGRIAFSIAARHMARKRIPLENTERELEDHPDTNLCNDPMYQTVADDERYRVHQALAGLAPLPRTIVSLYHLEGLSTAEIAQVCDLPAGTVKSHLFRARKILKTLLEDEG